MMNRTNASAQTLFDLAQAHHAHFSAQIVLDNEADYLSILSILAPEVTPNVTPDGNGIVRTDLTMADRLGYIGVSYYKPGTAKYLIGDNEVVRMLPMELILEKASEEIDLPDVPVRNAGLSLENNRVFVEGKEITGNVRHVDFKFGEKGTIESGSND